MNDAPSLLEKVSSSTAAVLSRAFLLLILPCLAGCQTAAYYAQAAHGHNEILGKQKPISVVLKDTKTPDSLKHQLELVLAMREFASRELKLPVNGHYRRYADLGRPYVVWNVTAAPEFSMREKSWWYPFVGRLEYRGYFDEDAARRYGAQLARDGYDVHVGGVQAYSTLGWFSDPVLNTFIRDPEHELAELLFHELGHQRLFVSGDTDFNEAFAESVCEEGTRRWLRAKKSTSEAEAYESYLRRKAEFTRLVTDAHDRLATLYRNADTADKCAVESKSLPPEKIAALRAQKQAVFEQLQRDYDALKATWGGQGEHDRWFKQPLNNARLNDVDTYYRLVPAFHQLLRDCGDDLEKFYRVVQQLAKLPKEERHRRLEQLRVSGSAPAR
ncbi:MAG: aminopeptidase [Verrucomicrobia bacterium]|nr:aminopeptidase [Verrucomicrobiota bacterium]